jgi:hypothetical protein
MQHLLHFTIAPYRNQLLRRKTDEHQATGNSQISSLKPQTQYLNLFQGLDLSNSAYYQDKTPNHTPSLSNFPPLQLLPPLPSPISQGPLPTPSPQTPTSCSQTVCSALALNTLLPNNPAICSVLTNNCLPAMLHVIPSHKAASSNYPDTSNTP